MVKGNLIGKRLKILMVVPQNLPHFGDDIIKRNFGCEVIFSPDDEDSIMQSVAGVDALIGCPEPYYRKSAA